jgi:malonyl CoA-acyl carrier protein transacylase
LQIRSEENLKNYAKNLEKMNKNSDIILNLDLDFFSPHLDYIDYNLKKKIILDASYKAKIITVSTSPFFIDQDLALKVLRDIFS